MIFALLLNLPVLVLLPCLLDLRWLHLFGLCFVATFFCLLLRAEFSFYDVALPLLIFSCDVFSLLWLHLFFICILLPNLSAFCAVTLHDVAISLYGVAT